MNVLRRRCWACFKIKTYYKRFRTFPVLVDKSSEAYIVLREADRTTSEDNRLPAENTTN